jgi:hypothetical protein
VERRKKKQKSKAGAKIKEAKSNASGGKVAHLAARGFFF